MGPGKYFLQFKKKGGILKCADYEQTNNKSLRSFEANCFLCLSTLFALEEFKIYEDFIQVSDLVEAQKIYVNRSELSTNGKVKLFCDLLQIYIQYTNYRAFLLLCTEILVF